MDVDISRCRLARSRGMRGCWSQFGWARHFAMRTSGWRRMDRPAVLEVELSQPLGLVGEMPFLL